MPVNLNDALRWESASADEIAMLNDLQGNILKGHGRHHTANLFFRFNAAQKPAALQWVHQMAARLTPALTQLRDAKKFHATGVGGGPLFTLLISGAGVTTLGVGAKFPNDATFLAGMKTRQAVLADPPSAQWDEPFKTGVHALLLIAANSPEEVQSERFDILTALPAGGAVTLVGEEIGLAQFNKNDDGIEHFGYVDGRSQPLLLKEDLDQEVAEDTGLSLWDAKFPLSQVLVPQPGAASPNSHGSFFVFRKLEQNVQAFKEREEMLADALNMTGDDRERAGAMAVGRFEDGTPVILQKGDGMHHPVPNNFNYDEDPAGAKCPFHAHVRKVNPRGPAFRAPIMARRGITYGQRQADHEDRPTSGVGLLFMAYQHSLTAQFEFTQQSWANNNNFQQPATGLDPVMGQGPNQAGGQNWHCPWGTEPGQPGVGSPGAVALSKKAFDFSHFVTLRGGDYFFAPAISTLANL